MGEQSESPVLDRSTHAPAPEPLTTSGAPTADLPGNQATLQGLVYGPQQATPEVELQLLREEADRRDAARANLVSEEQRITRARVPVNALVSTPPGGDEQLLYQLILADPSSAESLIRTFAAEETLAEYLDDKLDIMVTIELEDHDDKTWYAFSIDGEQLLVSTTLAFPVAVLDAVAQESLHEASVRITERVFQISSGAMLVAAYPTVGAPLIDEAMSMMADPADFSVDQAMSQHHVAVTYLGSVRDLLAKLDANNAWMRDSLEPIGHSLELALPFALNAFEAVNKFRASNVPEETPGETYDRLVEETDTGGKWGWFRSSGWRLWREAGEMASFGGHGMETQNAQLYRAGKISYNDYKENQWLNLGRSAVMAAVTALTAGEASPLALELFGLKGAAGTIAGVGVSGAAEGVVGGVVGAVTNDVYAEIVAHATSSEGVAAYYEATVGGPSAWLDAGAWGGMIGLGLATTGHLVTPKRVPTVPKGGQEPVIPREEAIAGEFEAAESVARPDLDPTSGPSVVVDATLVESEAQSSRFTTDPDFAIAGDQTLADMGGNDRVQVDASGRTTRIWRAFEKQQAPSLGADPNAPQVRVQLQQPKQFPGSSKTQRSVRPDSSQQGKYAEIKFRDWENPANADDLAGSLSKIETVESESGVSRGEPVQIITSKQVPLKARKQVLAKLRDQMRADGKSYAAIADFESRLVWSWRRPKPFF